MAENVDKVPGSGASSSPPVQVTTFHKMIHPIQSDSQNPLLNPANYYAFGANQTTIDDLKTGKIPDSALPPNIDRAKLIARLETLQNRPPPTLAQAEGPIIEVKCRDAMSSGENTKP
ncbi:hypothetical protein HK104_004280 [Borealophlyctis nickersoniae]|nr:hypothetical protein HK104_004280 [Borealophlyctis nickersoniae]